MTVRMSDQTLGAKRPWKWPKSLKEVVRRARVGASRGEKWPLVHSDLLIGEIVKVIPDGS